MISKDMVMVCVLARIQAEGLDLSALSQSEVGTLIAEAIADLRFAAEQAPRSHRAERHGQ